MKDVIVIPAAAAFLFILMFLNTHRELKPVYSVSVVYDYYIIDSYTTTDTTGANFPGAKIIIHQIY